MSLFRLRLRPAIIAGLLTLSLFLATVHARGDHPVDVWLAAHPKVADNIIWEFPPVVPYSKPGSAGSTQWTRYHVVPYPSIYPALTLDAFAGRETFVRSGRTDLSLEMLNEGFSPGRIEPTLPKPPKFTKPPKTVIVPGFNVDFIPSGEKVSDQGADIRAWPQWGEFYKQQLRNRFDDYLPLTTTACALYAEYAASGFSVKPAGFDAAFSILTDSDPVPLLDPPVNIQPDDPLVPGAPWDMMDSQKAFELHLRHVASQLALEIGGCLPWSVEDYSGAELGLLFDGRISLRYGAAGPSTWGTLSKSGHVVVGTVTPAPPMIVLGFLGQEKLIAPTRQETVERFLEWQRFHLWHVHGGAPNPPLPGGVLYWGYDGRAPVSRIIEGTPMWAPAFYDNGTSYFYPEPHHWVGGCGGASGFSAEVLRAVNIPVERTVYGHFQNRFSVGVNQRVSTAHADDPYGMIQAPEVPIGEILLDEAEFDEWFINENDPAVVEKNVARWTIDLWYEHLPLQLLKTRCADVANGYNHANSDVMEKFDAAYTVAEMEAKGLWDQLDAKLVSIGNCVALGFGNNVVVPAP